MAARFISTCEKMLKVYVIYYIYPGMVFEPAICNGPFNIRIACASNAIVSCAMNIVFGRE